MFRRDSNCVQTRRNPESTLQCILITGGCGFIGSNFINHFARQNPQVRIVNIDKLDYCSNTHSVEEDVRNSSRYRFVRGDICNSDFVYYLLKTEAVDTIVHFAAASHVDNSFGNSLQFSKSNVLGTHTLLECARVYGKIEKFVHVSTDEVYGEVTQTQSEGGFLNPTNPYAATKAAAEFIVKSYHISFGLPVLITRGNNVYGPYQYPEKVIPRFVMLLQQGKKLTIQGTGNNTRTFIHVQDVAKAFCTIIDKGVIGEIYNIGSKEEHAVLDIASRIIRQIKGPDARLDDYIEFVRDRAFNDTRYDISSAKLHALGWREEITFEEGLRQTVDWYYNYALPSNFWLNVKTTIDSEDVDHPQK